MQFELSQVRDRINETLEQLKMFGHLHGMNEVTADNMGITHIEYLLAAMPAELQPTI